MPRSLPCEQGRLRGIDQQKLVVDNELDGGGGAGIGAGLQEIQSRLPIGCTDH